MVGKKMFAALSAATLALGAFAGVARADQGETLYQYKHWEVELWSFDDGTYACLAEVDATTDSFTLWTYADNSVRLQFYSTDWDFGDTGDTANLQIEIDNRGHWSLTNADLYMNSVLFDLPDSDAGVDLLTEIAGGSRLYLRTEEGEGVKDYSLQGSRASIQQLIDCTATLSANPSNPFD